LRIVRFVGSDIDSYGLLINDEVLDMPKLSTLMDVSVPPSIEKLVSLGFEGERLVEGLLTSSTSAERNKATIKRGEIALRAPIAFPSKIICLGLNYRDHAEEAGAKIPDEPVIFMKPRTSIIGPDEPVVKPSFVQRLDYEVELAIVIGRDGKNVPLSEAKEHIFGYTAFNDISARDIQFKDGQWTRGKSFDTFAPIGPCITTAKQIGDPNNLRVYTRVNNEVRQNSSTRNMVFNVYEVVHQLSRVMTLEPCDIIATGTPSGVATFMKPKPRYLKPGDIVEVEVEGIGTLGNPIIDEIEYQGGEVRLNRLQHQKRP